MHGNTYEWTGDWYHRRLPGCADPDLHDVRRGGGWVDDGWACRSACRLRFEPERAWNPIGFRVVGVRP